MDVTMQKLHIDRKWAPLSVAGSYKVPLLQSEIAYAQMKQQLPCTMTVSVENRTRACFNAILAELNYLQLIRT